MTIDEAIEDYLDSLGATLWGQAYDISPEGRREQCIAFIRETVAQITCRVTS